MGADCIFQHEKAARRTNRDSWYFWHYLCSLERTSLVAPLSSRLHLTPGWEDPLEEETATYSGILA